MKTKPNACWVSFCFTGLTLTHTELKYNFWQDLLWHLFLFRSNVAWVLWHLFSTKVDKSKKKKKKRWTFCDLPMRHPEEIAVIRKHNLFPVMPAGFEKCAFICVKKYWNLLLYDNCLTNLIVTAISAFWIKRNNIIFSQWFEKEIIKYRYFNDKVPLIVRHLQRFHDRVTANNVLPHYLVNIWEHLKKDSIFCSSLL